MAERSEGLPPEALPVTAFCPMGPGAQLSGSSRLSAPPAHDSEKVLPLPSQLLPFPPAATLQQTSIQSSNRKYACTSSQYLGLA